MRFASGFPPLLVALAYGAVIKRDVVHTTTTIEYVPFVPTKTVFETETNIVTIYNDWQKPTSSKSSSQASTTKSHEYSNQYPQSINKHPVSLGNHHKLAVLDHGNETSSSDHHLDESKISETASMPHTSSSTSHTGKANETSTFTTIRGVNLGGWLVLEPWMNSDMFKEGGIDEWTLCETLGTKKCGEKLEKHWSSFITASDFAKMKEYGLNSVRIPIGYWAFQLGKGDLFYKGSQEKYLQKALGWARDNGLKVWIDLHGVPGSQNGYDHSGRANIHNWSNGNNMELTTKVLQQIAETYGGSEYSDVILGIELVNEPLLGGAGISQDKLGDFYTKAVLAIREKTSQTIVLQDGYAAQGSWAGKLFNKDKNLIYDTHLYSIFDKKQKAMDFDSKMKLVCSWGEELQKVPYREVVGEMTAAWDPQDGSVSYDGSISSWSSDAKKKLSRYAQAQFNAFEKKDGWFFWSWKVPYVPAWSFSDLVAEGVLPNPISKRTYHDCA